MFYFDTINNTKVLKSDFITDIEAFFTTREGFDFKNYPASRIITPTQTHSDNIEIIDERNSYPNTDGLILSKKNEAVYLRFADCTPLIFYDTKNKISAISHAGWRGCFQKIGVKTAEKMHANFGTKAEDITVLIGPSISICCYEVGTDVKEKLLSTVKNKDNLYKGNNIDLKMINAQQLREIGIRKIDICPYCTYCNNNLFYSYRKENGTDKRHYAVVKM